MYYLTDGKRHLICYPYSIENLHLMAEELEINKAWYHASPYPHYDIPKSRIAEIESKCHMISSKKLLRIIKNAN